jgi:hypothetical protein
MTILVSVCGMETKGGEACVEGGGHAPTAVKDSSIAHRTNVVALGIILAATSGTHRGSRRHEVAIGSSRRTFYAGLATPTTVILAKV